MIKLTSNEIYEEVYELSFGFSYGAIWANIWGICVEQGIIVTSHEGWNLRKKLFLEITERLLIEGKIKFNKFGGQEIVKLSIPEQMPLIEDNLPVYGSQDPHDDLDDIGLWFWAKCPVGIVWVSDDGSYIWT